MDLETVLDSVENNQASKNLSGPNKLGNDIESKDLTNGFYVVGNDDTCENETGFSNTNHVETKKEASSSAKRGQGLRKWRRIRRDLRKGGDSYVETSKHLSPERANSGAGSSKRQVRVDRYQKTEGSSVVRNFDGNGLVGDIGKVFADGTDSENSEDRSSKSSTAASAPKVKKDRSTFGSGSHGKSTMAQSLQQGKGRTEDSKKARGNRGKFEKENSYSSVESDLRSSGFVIMQGKQFMSNGIHGERSISHGNGGSYGGNGNRGYEEMSSENVFVNSAWEVKEERTNGHSSSIDQDLLFALQSVPEALEREVLKFKEISKDIEQNSEVTENSFKTAQSEAVETAFRHVEKELEDLYKKKIEAEVEYLVISRKAQTMGTTFVDQLTLLEEQKVLASEQTQILNKLGDTENKAAMLNKEAEKLERICENFAIVDETLKLQNSVWKYTCCFFVQLLVLVVIILVFVSKLPMSSVEFVPT